MSEEPGVDTAMRVAGILPSLGPGERDCPTCRGAGYLPDASGLVALLCPKCEGERKVPVPTPKTP